MIEVFPELGEPWEVPSVFWRPHLFLSPDSLLFQRDLGEYGAHLWLADLDEGSLSVADPSWPSNGRLAGGISMNARLAVLLRSTEGAVELLRYSDGAIDAMGSFPAGRIVDARELSRSASALVFLLRTHHPSETGTSQVLVFDGETVRPLLEREGLADADLATGAAGRVLAVSVWREGKRALEVHGLHAR